MTSSTSGERVAELSPAQEGLFFLQQLVPESHAYNVAWAWRVRGLDPELFRRAGERLVQRHPQLRVGFEMGPGGPRQRLHPTRPFAFEVVDGRGRSAAWLEERLGEHTRRRFDLARDPLLRVTAFASGPDEHVLLIVSHHLVSDLWSGGRMLEELGHLYGEQKLGVPADLPALTVDYMDHAAQLRARMAGPEGDALWSFWEEELRGPLRPLRLPQDRPSPALPGLKGATCLTRIPPEALGRLRQLCEGEGATLFAGLMAALAAQLHLYSGQEDVVVSAPVHGRPRRALHPVHGQFVNSTVVRTRPRASMGFDELLRQTLAATYRSLRHSEYPFHHLIQRLGPHSRGALSQIQLAFQHLACQPISSGLAERRLVAGALTYELVPLDAEEGQFDLHFLLYLEGDALRVELKYATELFDGETARRIAGDFAEVVEQVSRTPRRPLSELAGQLRAHARVDALSDDEVERQLRALLGQR